MSRFFISLTSGIVYAIFYLLSKFFIWKSKTYIIRHIIDIKVNKSNSKPIGGSADALMSVVCKTRTASFDDIKTMMKQAQLREIFTGMEVVYVYHNQIDARVDKQNTENEVFTACAEAIEEIYSLIKRLSGSANTYHFIVTADHGFIYKRDKLTESDKIGGATGKGAFVNRRFIVSDDAVQDDGVDWLL